MHLSYKIMNNLQNMLITRFYNNNINIHLPEVYEFTSKKEVPL